MFIGLGLPLSGRRPAAAADPLARWVWSDATPMTWPDGTPVTWGSPAAGWTWPDGSDETWPDGTFLTWG